MLTYVPIEIDKRVDSWFSAADTHIRCTGVRYAWVRFECNFWCLCRLAMQWQSEVEHHIAALYVWRAQWWPCTELVTHFVWARASAHTHRTMLSSWAADPTVHMQSKHQRIQMGKFRIAITIRLALIVVAVVDCAAAAARPIRVLYSARSIESTRIPWPQLNNAFSISIASAARDTI